MQRSKNELLGEIQVQREKMIESAQNSGYTSVETIRCSQELDKLIYRYQCKVSKQYILEGVSELALKQTMLIYPKRLVNF